MDFNTAASNVIPKKLVPSIIVGITVGTSNITGATCVNITKPNIKFETQVGGLVGREPIVIDFLEKISLNITHIYVNSHENYYT